MFWPVPSRGPPATAPSGGGEPSEDCFPASVSRPPPRRTEVAGSLAGFPGGLGHPQLCLDELEPQRSPMYMQTQGAPPKAVEMKSAMHWNVLKP